MTALDHAQPLLTTITISVTLQDMHRRYPALAVTAALSLSGCGNAGSQSSDSSGGEKLGVVASFYPLEYAVQRVGGEHVEVTSLTRPGVDAHDAELSAKDVAVVSEADLAVYEKNLQPAVDSAIASQGVKNTLDVADAADLSLTFTRGIGERHDTDDKDKDHGHDVAEGAIDPHFWLDPVRFGEVAQAISAKLQEIDPDNGQTYAANAAAFVGDLQNLDGEFRSGLKTCASRDLVTSHAAFGYLVDRYGMHQVSISGLSPEDEPDPGTLAVISDFIEQHKVKTVYTETLANPAITRTLASETGAIAAVLDPIEGLGKDAAGRDYLDIMRSNLQTLKKGQGCS